MSFKRDGDDVSLFKQVQKRQVSELFTEDIPDDEARKEKNGRLICLVCGNKPLFDTVNMLVVHRQGKKHTYWNDRFQQQKQELLDLKQKRAHELSSGSNVPCHAAAGNAHCRAGSGMVLGLKTVPYNPYSKRTGRKSKPYDRREILNLHDDVIDVSYANPRDSNSKIVRPERIKRAKSEGIYDQNNCDSDVKSPCEQKSKSSFVSKDAQLKSQTINDYLKLQKIQKTNEPVLVRPYGSKTFIPRNISKNEINDSFYSRSSVSEVSSQQSFVNKGITQEEDRFTQNAPENYRPDPFSNTYSVATKLSMSSTTCDQHIYNSIGMVRKYGDKAETKTKHTSGLESSNTGEECNPRSTEKKEYLDKYLQAIRNGWKRDRGGQWVRDPDVEFDSDEEPPLI